VFNEMSLIFAVMVDRTLYQGLTFGTGIIAFVELIK
jgi:hypothetical protein